MPTLQGLTEQEAAARRSQGQGNTAPPPTGRTYAQILRDNFLTFINIAIFSLGVALVLVGRPMDALLSVGIIVVNIMVSVVQEVRAKRILDRVALLTRPTARVIRDGQEKAVAPEELVLGDLLKVGPGDQILVDGRVVEGQLSVDESQLTGESDLVRKQAGDELFSGSFCVSGSAAFVAEKVGEASFANQLTANARAYRRMVTPLQQQINLVVRLILLIVIYLQLLLIANNLLNAVPLPRGVAQATVIVSLVPNGLFLSIAVAYALAAVRIVRFGALIQQSNAVESLSNVDVLCLDKTGTLTTNQLRLDRVIPLAGDEQALQQIVGTMVASSRTQNKTSEAIAAALPATAQKSVAEVPFSSARKWSAVALDEELRGVYALGAPEMLRPYLDGVDAWEAITEQTATLTRAGLRVLLVAHHPDPSQLRDDGDASTLPASMAILGIASFSDELRPEAREVLASFIDNGVNPKIISGDHPETVAALARQAGLDGEAKLVSGLELAELDAAQFDAAALSNTIFGRITPQQKEQLVEALRRHGHFVAMIGDGVNDVLSLKKANLGIAMQSGSQATRGVADIVLINDSFAALSPAVAEGQRIVNGMQDILKLFLTRIATMMLLIISAWTIGIFPIAVRQGTVVTLLTVGIPSVLLAIWARPGYRYHHSLMARLLHFVAPPALVTSVLGLAVFYLPLVWRLPSTARALSAEQYLVTYELAIHASQTALSAFLVITGLLLIPFVEPPNEWWVGGDALSRDKRPTWLAVGLAFGFGLIMTMPPLRAFFDLASLRPPHLATIAICVVIWLVMVRLIWRHQLIERSLGINPAKS
jgi:cation-transporting ATPase E